MIIFKQVTKQFQRDIVLDHVDLTITLGEHIALIGANGAGKTTLIRCLLGEYKYDGHILVNGTDSRYQRQQLLSQVGFVPQHPPPLKIPVKQLIHFAAELCQTRPEAIIDYAEQLGLKIGVLFSRPFNKLSGGQKQKLLISIALGHHSQILILDEPSANLDPEARQIFFNLLKEKQNNMITFISSHRLDELKNLVNRVIELESGKITKDISVTQG